MMLVRLLSVPLTTRVLVVFLFNLVFKTFNEVFDVERMLILVKFNFRYHFVWQNWNPDGMEKYIEDDNVKVRDQPRIGGFFYPAWIYIYNIYI